MERTANKVGEITALVSSLTTDLFTYKLVGGITRKTAQFLNDVDITLTTTDTDPTTLFTKYSKFLQNVAAAGCEIDSLDLAYDNRFYSGYIDGHGEIRDYDPKRLQAALALLTKHTTKSTTEPVAKLLAKPTLTHPEYFQVYYFFDPYYLASWTAPEIAAQKRNWLGEEQTLEASFTAALRRDPVSEQFPYIYLATRCGTVSLEFVLRITDSDGKPLNPHSKNCTSFYHMAEINKFKALKTIQTLIYTNKRRIIRGYPRKDQKRIAKVLDNVANLIQEVATQPISILYYINQWLQQLAEHPSAAYKKQIVDTLKNTQYDVSATLAALKGRTGPKSAAAIEKVIAENLAALNEYYEPYFNQIFAIYRNLAFDYLGC